jgi:hypothetical protein
VVDGHEATLQSRDGKGFHRRLTPDVERVEVVVLVGDGLGDALAGRGVCLVSGVDREVAGQSEDVARAVEVVEVDVRDDGGVGDGQPLAEKLVAKIGAQVDQ